MFQHDQYLNFAIILSNSTTFQKVAKLLKLNQFWGSKTNPQNYRPISLLPLLSKIIEKIVYNQTQEILSKNKILYRFQLGFPKNYSTNTCLRHFTDKITTGFEEGFFTGRVLIDLSVWHHWPPDFTKENEIFRLFQKHNCMV